MQDPGIEVLVGVDMAKADHFAQAMTVDGRELFARSVLNDEAAILELIDEASERGQAALIIDMQGAGPARVSHFWGGPNVTCSGRSQCKLCCLVEERCRAGGSRVRSPSVAVSGG